MDAAKTAMADYGNALHLRPKQPNGWTPRVLACSAFEKVGMNDLLHLLEDFRNQLTVSGYFQANRHEQATAWFKSAFQSLLTADPLRFPNVVALEEQLRSSVRSLQASPRDAARKLLDEYHKAIARARDY